MIAPFTFTLPPELAAREPPERRGLVLIDPPYEAPDEFATAARAVEGALARFATGIVLIWFPIKSRAAAAAFAGEVLAAGARKAVQIDIAVAAEPGKLASAGLIAVNPPFGFEDGMRAGLAPVVERLGPEARFEVRRLAGE